MDIMDISTIIIEMDIHTTTMDTTDTMDIKVIDTTGDDSMLPSKLNCSFVLLDLWISSQSQIILLEIKSRWNKEMANYVESKVYFSS